MNFNKVLENLKTDNYDTISYRYHRIVKTINCNYWGRDSDSKNCRFAGSYGRGTAIKGFSDVDIIIKLPLSEHSRFSKYETNGQSALLQNVKNALNYSYSRSATKGDGQVVIIEFSDGLKFEIVPAFEIEEGRLTYPDANNSGVWKQCDPSSEKEAINIVNRYYDGKLKKICKLTRAWKIRNKINISGVLIDTLATKFFLNDKDRILSLELTFIYFLLYLVQQDTQIFWTIPGSNDTIQRKDMTFERNALQAAETLLKAMDLENSNKLLEADLLLGSVFGRFMIGA